MRTTAVILVLAAPAIAQYPIGANALRWIGTTSTAGPFCWGFSCTPVQVTVLPGESATVFVRSEYNDAYVIALSLTATSCLSLPGYLHQLALDAPVLWQIGLCGTPSPVLACPSGYDNLAVTIPPFFPPGLQFAMQGVTGPFAAAGSFSFTQPIHFTVL